MTTDIVRGPGNHPTEPICPASVVRDWNRRRLDTLFTTWKSWPNGCYFGGFAKNCESGWTGRIVGWYHPPFDRGNAYVVMVGMDSYARLIDGASPTEALCDDDICHYMVADLIALPALDQRPSRMFELVNETGHGQGLVVREESMTHAEAAKRNAGIHCIKWRPQGG